MQSGGNAQVLCWGGAEVTFAYDGLLRRIRMTEGETVSYFRHDAMSLLDAEHA